VNDLFLGIIAVATLAIAIAQIGVMVVAGLLARRIGRLGPSDAASGRCSVPERDRARRGADATGCGAKRARRSVFNDRRPPMDPQQPRPRSAFRLAKGAPS
jgi:hypothetical protein